MGYLNDATGRLCDWGYLRTECYGARLPADYRGEVPAQMLLTDIPEGEYLVVLRSTPTAFTQASTTPPRAAPSTRRRPGASPTSTSIPDSISSTSAP